MVTDPAREELLVLVDGLDREVGTATKRQAHVEGMLHRAFSVVLVRDCGDSWEILLSRRAEGKYHSGGLWANSCCSHPRAGEDIIEAGYRRVREELGCDSSGLREIAAFVYRAEFESGLVEHEYDHVLLGRFEGELEPDSSEVDGVRWVGIDELASELAEQPKQFCAWAHMVLSIVLAELASSV